MARFNLLPENYVAPASEGGQYLTIDKDKNEIRIAIAGPITVGWEYWNTSGVGVRLKDKPEKTPADIRREGGKADTVKHFWAFPAIDIDANRVGIFQVSQSSIREAMMKAFDQGYYDFAGGEEGGGGFHITRKGSGKQGTKYDTSAIPLKTPRGGDLTPSEELYAEAAAIDVESVIFGGEDKADVGDKAKAAEIM